MEVLESFLLGGGGGGWVGFGVLGGFERRALVLFFGRGLRGWGVYWGCFLVNCFVWKSF